MFCSHCGSQLPEGAKFCQKCGARLEPSDSAQTSPVISGGNKKKSKKIPIILGAVVLVVILAVVVVLNWEGKTDYVYDEGYDDLSGLNTDFAENDDASKQSEPETVDNGSYAEYEERARLVLFEWFDRHPLIDSIKVEFMNEIADANTGGDGYLVYEMFTIEGEEYGMIHVSPDSGEILMDSIMDVTGQWSPVQITMDQWYLEYYWGWTDDSGYYSEDYDDDCTIIYDGTDIEILEYSPSYDSYAICNYDGQCLIEYDDGTEESEVSISDFTGTYSYDASIDAEEGFLNFYYQLEIGKWDGDTLPIMETWRGNTVLDGEWARPKSLIVDTLTFDIFAADDAGYESHSLTYIPAKNSPLGKDVILIDGDDTMPFVRE